MKTYLMLTMVLFIAACASPEQNMQNQNVAVMDSELMVLDLQNQDPQSARMHLNEAESLAPDDPQVLVAAGYFDLHMGDKIGAETAYAAAIRQAPHDSEIENDYGRFLYQQGQYSQALVYFIASAQDPGNAISAAANQNAGFAEVKLKQPALAQYYFEQADQEDPDMRTSS